MFVRAKRLVEERQKLGVSVADMAKKMGISRSTQYNYENGERSPDMDYLDKAASIGIDVSYVITGQRTGAPVPLSPDEAALLENYRKNPEEGKQVIQATSKVLAKKE